jgi:hypothetical protein
MQALQWPEDTQGTRGMHAQLAIPALQDLCESATVEIGKAYGLYTTPHWKRKLRVISQFLHRMDLAWVVSNTAELDSGVTTSVLEFYAEEHSTRIMSLDTAVLLLGCALNAMRGRDVSCKADRRDQRVPTSPQRHGASPTTPRG